MKETTSGWLSQLTKGKWHSCAGWRWVYQVVHLPAIEPSTEQMQIFKVLIGTSCLCWKGNDILLIKTILTVGSSESCESLWIAGWYYLRPFHKGWSSLFAAKQGVKEGLKLVFFLLLFLSTVGHFLSLFLKTNKQTNMLSCSFVAAVDDKQKKSRRKGDFIGIKVKKRLQNLQESVCFTGLVTVSQCRAALFK